MKLSKDLHEFIALLNSHGVDYVIVGGHAVAFHGYPRFTGDIDIFIRPTSGNATLVLSALDDFGFAGPGISLLDLTGANRVIELGQPPNRIDLLTGISGVSFDEAWSGKVAGKLDDLDVQFLGRAELLRNKQASGRPKDLADIDNL